MDRGGGTLRKRALSIGATGTEVQRDSKASWQEARAVPRGDGMAVEEEPMSPTGQLFREPHISCCIVSVFGLGAPVSLAAARAGLEATLARHPRFCSVQVLDELEKGARPKWVRTTVNLDNHIIVPDLDPTATSADPDRVLEDYVSSLSALPMDHSRPLWELHVLDFPTAEAAAALALRVHHSLGDGASLLSLLIACTRSAADPDSLPALPPAGGRAGPVYALQRPPLAAGALALVMWVMSFLVLAWNTVVDVVCFVATATSLVGDAQTLFKGEEGVEFRPKRFVNRTLSLDDVKYVKNAMNCTVNDVLLGVSSAALSRYYFRKSGESDRKNIKSASHAGQPCSIFKAFAMAHKGKAKSDVGYNPEDGPEAYSNATVHNRLSEYTSMARDLHGPAYDPSTEDLDGEVVMMVGGGKKHGRYLIGDGAIDSATTPSLSQIRARAGSTRTSLAIRPRQDTSHHRVQALEAQLEQERRIREQMQANMERVEAERQAEQQRMAEILQYMQSLGAATGVTPPPSLFATPPPPPPPPNYSTPNQSAGSNDPNASVNPSPNQSHWPSW